MNRRFFSRSFFFAVALVTSAMAPHAKAGSDIFWGNDINNDVMIDSLGNALGSQFSFEMGSFRDGFNPTMDNVNLWVANWMVFDRSFDPTPDDLTDPDSEGWESVNQILSGYARHTDLGGSDSLDANPADVFIQGQIVYMWVYNTKDREAGTEWALVTSENNLTNTGNAWVFPDPLEVDGSYTWNLADADLAIAGGVHGVSGGQAFTIQTSIIPVPEPSSALLVGLTALGALLRRRRK
jgi:hypothetical protein